VPAAAQRGGGGPGHVAPRCGARAGGRGGACPHKAGPLTPARDVALLPGLSDDQAPLVHDIVLQLMSELSHLGVNDRIRINSAALAALEEARPHACLLLELVPAAVVLIGSNVPSDSQPQDDGARWPRARPAAKAGRAGGSPQGPPSCEPAGGRRGARRAGPAASDPVAAGRPTRQPAMQWRQLLAHCSEPRLMLTHRQRGRPGHPQRPAQHCAPRLRAAPSAALRVEAGACQQHPGRDEGHAHDARAAAHADGQGVPGVQVSSRLLQRTSDPAPEPEPLTPPPACTSWPCKRAGAAWHGHGHTSRAAADGWRQLMAAHARCW